MFIVCLAQVGIGLNPKTDVSKVLPFVESADMILIMTVEPGFGGQKFMQDMMPKVKMLREKFPDLDIEVDGGVGLPTIQHCAQVKDFVALKILYQLFLDQNTSFYYPLRLSTGQVAF